MNYNLKKKEDMKKTFGRVFINICSLDFDTIVIINNSSFETILYGVEGSRKGKNDLVNSNQPERK